MLIVMYPTSDLLISISRVHRLGIRLWSVKGPQTLMQFVASAVTVSPHARGESAHAKK